MGMDFSRINNYIDQIVITDDLLEIGSERGEGSTAILGSIAHNSNKILHSVDIDKTLISYNTQKHTSNPIKFYNLKGEDFLDQNNHLKFSIVLLDNFDWNWHPLDTPDWIQNQITDYKNIYNLEMNNLNSQKTHLIQSIKLTNMLADQCIIVCDDTWVLDNQGIYCGKCGAAIPYLLSLGFSINHEPWGVILIRAGKS
jgi:hypothetical protein